MVASARVERYYILPSLKYKVPEKFPVVKQYINEINSIWGLRMCICQTSLIYKCRLFGFQNRCIYSLLPAFSTIDHSRLWLAKDENPLFAFLFCTKLLREK